jgi:hypothetical protein
MSTPVSNTASAVKDVKEKKPRTPTLPAKFGKFIQFGYWFMKRINDDPDVPAVDERLFTEKLNLFSGIEDQQSFVQAFFDDSKEIAKELRKTLQQQKKDAAKAAKALAKAEAKAQNKNDKADKKPLRSEKKKEKTDSEPPSEDPTKKPRGRKKKVLTSDDAFVNEMVHLANGLPVDNIPPQLSPVKSQSNTETKVTKVTKATKSETKSETKTETKVAKPETKATKANKPNKVTKDKVKSNDLTNEQQTHVSILNLNEKQYLIDDKNIVYDFHTHLPLGTFNHNNLTISDV